MSSPRCILALDQGTTSSRAIVFDHDGAVLGLAQQEFPQHFPRPGWVEHDPEDIWRSQAAVAVAALERAGVTAAEVAAVGIANQRETTVLWERASGRPLAPAIVWQDRRTADACRALREAGREPLFRERTGLVLDPYFSGTKLAWLLDQTPGARRRAAAGELCCGTIDSWLAWRLTGGAHHVTDASNASRTLLCNLGGEWDAELLDALAIPAPVLPAIVDSSGVIGPVTAIPELAGVPLAALVGDQQGALAGQACFGPGVAKNTYGTGCFMLLNTGTKPVQSKNGLLTTLGYKIGNQPAVYCLEGSIAITGALVQWLRDNLGLIAKSADVETLANTVEDNGGIYFVPAFSGLFAPYWKNDARGAIVGMTRYVNKGHFARAAQEATAYQTREVLDAMNKDSGVKLKALKVDGGMVFNDTLMQFQSDILGVPVIRPTVAETTALGAAYAAGLAVGYWTNVEDLRANWAKDHEWKPQMKSQQREKLYAGWKKAVTRTFDWVE